MALTEETVEDKIEIVGEFKHVQVRTATIIKKDGVELTRSFHRHVVNPFNSVANRDSDGKITGWTHTATDISGEDASVQAIANAAWTDTVKNNYKAYRESQIS